MSLEFEALNEHFGARVHGLPSVDDLDDATFGALRASLDDYGVLVLPSQPMDDDRQIRFSERFGPMERTISANPAGGTPFARQSNLDLRTGGIIPASDRRMDYQKGNMQWHADSTFKAIPSLCSILSAREVPPEGGDTEFASTRAAFEALEPARQAALADLEVEHSVVYSRRQVGFEFTAAEAAEMPAARHPLVQVNPRTARRSLLVGAHAARITGWPEREGRELLDELLALATRPEHCFGHRWQQDDVVIWDNRAVLHRATPYDAGRFRRLMQRTTVSNPV